MEEYNPRHVFEPFNPGYEADPDLISRLREVPSGQELLNWLGWQIESRQRELVNSNLTDPNNAGNVGFMQGQLHTLWHLTELILGEHISRDELKELDD